MSKSNQTPHDLAWSFPLAVVQLPEAGLHQVIEASAAERAQIASAAGLDAVTQAKASFDIVPAADGSVNVTGRVRARVGQTCVVTLDPVENEIDEAVTVVFAPPALIAVSSKSVQKEEGEDVEIADLPEPIVNGAIDLGQLALEFLMLGIDPYPRKPDAVFVAPATPADPDDHPFAALKALKAPPRTSKGRKPGGK